MKFTERDILLLI